MRRVFSSLTAPVLLAVALLLSSCVGAVVQSSLVPHDRGAALADFATQPSGVRALYAQGTAGVSYPPLSSGDQPIPGMSITLPVATTGAHNALVTFSASTTYPQSGATCTFTIYNGSSKTSAVGATYNPAAAISYIPMTLVERIALTTTTQKLAVEWNNGGTGFCSLSNFYSLSAILAN